MILTGPLTGGPLEPDTPHSLWAPGERWPVVEGIPFLRGGRAALAAEALRCLDGGDAETAAVVLLGDQDDWARTPPPAEADRRVLLREAGQVTFREAMDRLAFGPVGTYFAHRWSDPTFLSGLALAEAHRAHAKRVFELACGAGHFLREFARFAPDVSGGDVVWAKLWLARRFVSPGARLLCFDAAYPWPLPEASADLVFCHDAFYFLPDKPHVAREMRRVGGRVLVGHAHNALVDNLSSGSPLPPAEYAGLLGAEWWYDDRELTAALVEARAPMPSRALDGAAAVSFATGPEPPRAVAGGLALPPADAALRPNPLYRDGAVAWPSERYRTEYGPLATYPMQASGAPDAVRRRELVDLPERW